MTDGQDAHLLKEIGRSLQLLNRFEEAVDAYRRYLQAVPQDSPGRTVVLPWLRESSNTPYDAMNQSTLYIHVFRPQ